MQGDLRLNPLRMDGNQPLRAEEKLVARDGKYLQHDIAAVAADHAVKRQLARFASRLEQPVAVVALIQKGRRA